MSRRTFYSLSPSPLPQHPAQIRPFILLPYRVFRRASSLVAGVALFPESREEDVRALRAFISRRLRFAREDDPLGHRCLLITLELPYFSAAELWIGKVYSPPPSLKTPYRPRVHPSTLLFYLILISHCRARAGLIGKWWKKNPPSDFTPGAYIRRGESESRRCAG